MLHFAVKVYAGPGIRGSIQQLALSQFFLLPVAQSLSLTDAHAEEIGIQLLQTSVGYAHTVGLVLKFHKVAWFKLGTPVQLGQVIVPRKSYFWYCAVFEQTFDGRRNASIVQTEQKTRVKRAYLQERHFVAKALRERRACLCIDTQDVLGEQMVYCGFGLFRGVNNYNAPVEENLRQCINFLFVERLKYLLHQCVIYYWRAKLKKNAEKKISFSFIFSNFAEYYFYGTRRKPP